MITYLNRVLRRFRVLALGVIVACSLLPASAAALQLPNTAQAIPANFSTLAEECTKAHFFGLKPWYAYLSRELDDGSKGGDKCDVRCFNLTQQGTKPNACGEVDSDIPLVLLAVIDDLLRIAALVTLGYIIYAAFRYTASQGNPEQTAKAQSTLVNAMLGLAIATIAVAFVSYLGHQLGSIT